MSAEIIQKISSEYFLDGPRWMFSMCIGRYILERDRMAAPQTYWRDYTSLLAWQQVKIHQEELESVSAYKDV